MDLETAKQKAWQLFNGIEPAKDCTLVEVGKREASGLGFVEQIHSMTPVDLPLPGLLQYGFTQLLELETDGPWEKMAWGLHFSLRGSTFGFEYRKFGLRALCEPRNLDLPILGEVLGKARALTHVAEQYLSSGFVNNQLAAGSFTAKNLYDSLDMRYRFLRAQAERAYATPVSPPIAEDTEFGTTEFFTMVNHDRLRPEREGGTLASAAVDAYFSRLEHLFVLAAAFQPAGLPPDGMLKFLASNWSAKARTALNLSDPRAKRFYDKFIDIREEWRNPLVHGGFLSKGGSLYFHLPGVGALPAQLRQTPDGVRGAFLIRSSNFSEIATLLDEFDAFARDVAFQYPLMWIESGLDVAFDADSLREYHEAMSSEEHFKQFIEFMQHQWERQENMEY